MCRSDVPKAIRPAPIDAKPDAGLGSHLIGWRFPGPGHKETSMAKGQMRSSKEKKKPKAEKKEKGASAYQQQFGKTRPASMPIGKKDG
jgi:hypothetical protein